MRASRLLSILILLQLRQRLTAADLAAEFEVSMRTVYRDIDALSAAGIPVYGDRGPGGGFQLLDGYRTRLTGLDPQEAQAMLLVGLPEQAAALGLGGPAKRARGKLLAALPQSGSAEADRIARAFHIDTLDWYRAARPAPLLTAAARAVIDRRRIAIRYTSWRGTRDWTLDPLGIVLKAGNHYLVAARDDRVLTFTVAAMRTLTILDEQAARPADFDLAAWWATSTRDFETRLRPDRAILRASPIGLERLRLLGAWAADAVAVAEPPDATGHRRLTLPIEGVDAAAPMLLGIGPEIDILDPPGLRAAVANLARAVADRLAVADPR
ncbi:MAG: WYL domain-containing protein [Sphingopyxis sp.]|nr:WYL domain-containing protein [Sphingopyxis sp.]